MKCQFMNSNYAFEIPENYDTELNNLDNGKLYKKIKIFDDMFSSVFCNIKIFLSKSVIKENIITKEVVISNFEENDFIITSFSIVNLNEKQTELSAICNVFSKLYESVKNNSFSKPIDIYKYIIENELDFSEKTFLKIGEYKSIYEFFEKNNSKPNKDFIPMLDVSRETN